MVIMVMRVVGSIEEIINKKAEIRKDAIRTLGTSECVGAYVGVEKFLTCDTMRGLNKFYG
jgi:hypothetical protein